MTMKNLSDSEYRRRLIARVEALRLDARITKHDFHQQIGPLASAFWKRFEIASDEEVWQHFSLKSISRIGEVSEWAPNCCTSIPEVDTAWLGLRSRVDLTWSVCGSA
jgi:hypothetical protein